MVRCKLADYVSFISFMSRETLWSHSPLWVWVVAFFPSLNSNHSFLWSGYTGYDDDNKKINFVNHLYIYIFSFIHSFLLSYGPTLPQFSFLHSFFTPINSSFLSTSLTFLTGALLIFVAHDQTHVNIFYPFIFIFYDLRPICLR